MIKRKKIKRKIMTGGSLLIACLLALSMLSFAQAKQKNALKKKSILVGAVFPKGKKGITLKWSDYYVKKQKSIAITRFTLNRKTFQRIKDSKKTFQIKPTKKHGQFMWTDKSIKENNFYHYNVAFKGYDILEKKNAFFSGGEDAYTGIASPYFNEYLAENEDYGVAFPVVVSGSQVNVYVEFENWDEFPVTSKKSRIFSGRDAEGFVYYRSTDRKNYQKVGDSDAKSVRDADYGSPSNLWGCFPDHTVKEGETYYYKVKAYYRSGGQKRYSRFSRDVKVEVKNPEPGFAGKIDLVSPDKKEVVYRISSDRMNPDVVIPYERFRHTVLPFRTADIKDGTDPVKTEFQPYKYHLTEYSLDEGSTWTNVKNLKKNIKLVPGNAILLKMVTDGELWTYGTGDIRLFASLVTYHGVNTGKYRWAKNGSCYVLSVPAENAEALGLTKVYASLGFPE